MFERLFGRKERSNREHSYEWKTPLLIPGFITDPAMEELAEKFVSLGQQASGLLLDGAPEDLAAAEARLKEAEKGEVGHKLREYLRPYIERDLPEELGPSSVHPSEYNRVYAAGQLKHSQ